MKKVFESWNSLLDIQIKPLRSRAARTIFHIFMEFKYDISLTTLDIERKLREIDVNLDKKEINGWLGSLLRAGLISKEKVRGKPTTFQYYEKYTFDLWKITHTGINVAKGLTNFYNINSIPLEMKSLLNAIQGLNLNDVKKFLKQINELGIISQVMSLISKGSDPISTSIIANTLKI